MDDQQVLREQLTVLLKGGKAHLPFEDILTDYPKALRGKVMDEIPYTPWQLLEHIRIAQWDIVKYCVHPEHEYLNWPDDYWPPQAIPPQENAWSESVEKVIAERDEMIALINNPAIDLFQPLPQNERHNILREALLLADHNSYHLGQIVLIRKVLEKSKS